MGNPFEKVEGNMGGKWMINYLVYITFTTVSCTTAISS